MHLLLTACGSYGDVLPMLNLAVVAAGRGHRAAIIANPHFQPLIESREVEFIGLGDAEDYRWLTQHPDLWHPLRGPRLVLRYGAGGLLQQLYEIIADHYHPGETVLAAHGLDMASRVFQEKRQAPLATVHFAPLSIRSLAATPRFNGMLTSAAAPTWVKALQFWLADRAVIDPLINGPMDELRTQLGLGRVRRYYDGWANSPDLVLGLFPAWFAAPQKDWPAAIELVGFPLSLHGDDLRLPPPVEAFLAEGAPPIVFAPGSANAQANQFFRTAIDVCQRLRRRGVLLTKYPEQLPEALPNGVVHFDFVPFGALLPRAAAAVHHGGIGSCAQALAAGIPQLAMPMAYDQLDNATRLKDLGVGEYVPAKKFRPDRVEQLLTRLITSTQVRDRCGELARQCDAAAPLETACDLLEGLLLRDSERRRSESSDSHKVADPAVRAARHG